MSFKRFEDIIAWQKARELTKRVYALTRNGDFARDYGLTDQIRRAAVSVMSNISEGYERGTKEEFIHFLYIAKGSCGEVRAQLYAALDQDYITEGDFEDISSLAVETSRLIYHLIEYLKGTNIRGAKFKKPPVKNFREEVQDLLSEYSKKE
ncbi:MAG: four helix bundle protein [Thermodesulfobacteriota bacterium]|nr:four helix bundle protein [Thermodesulfobacteriota bacterium]